MENPLPDVPKTVAPGAALTEHYTRMRIPVGQEFPIKSPCLVQLDDGHQGPTSAQRAEHHGQWRFGQW